MRTQLSKTVLAAIAVSFVSSMAFAAGLPGNCTEEILTLSKGSGFDMQKFTSNLPSAVAKAKLQAKVPFGQPKSSDKTDIGMSFGCLNAFPESPSEIQSVLKDISQEIAKDAVANQLYENAQEAPQMQAQYQQAQPQQTQPQYSYPQQQYNYQPPPYQYQQQFSPQYTNPPKQEQCPQSRIEYFTAGERWGTWTLNMLIPGLGSAVIMNDYAGMGIQMGLTALGIVFITALGWEEYNDSYYGGNYCASYNSYGNCNYYNYYNHYDNYERETVFLPIGIGLLAVNFIFNIARSNSYNEPPNNHASNEHGGFNLAVLPNRHGEVMPYLMYNKTF
jgi:hypothetical protein